MQEVGIVEQLTTLDAGFLEAEDSDRHISLAIGGLVILEGPPPDYDSLVSTLGARISGCRRFGQKLQLHPFDLAPPEWVDDPDFATALLDRVTGISERRATALARAGVDIICLGDDIGTQSRLMLSPATYRRWLKPRLRRVVGWGARVARRLLENR